MGVYRTSVAHLEGVGKSVILPHGVPMVRVQGSQLASTQRSHGCRVEDACRCDCIVESQAKGRGAAMTWCEDTAGGAEYLVVAPKTGDGFEEDISGDVNGAVVQVRPKFDKLAVWTADVHRASNNIRIGKTLKERLYLFP
ncbi:hypothetical protein MRX96_016959 [Rhipicephalus microplus]